MEAAKRMKRLLSLNVNGQSYDLAISPNRTLVEVLREDVGLTGTKRGCNEGDCGACTVLVNNEPVLSCMMLAVDAHDQEIITIEGLAVDGQLHPVQQAFIDHGALQCGFCTPGMILTAKYLLDQDPNLSDEEIRSGLAGNLCRCTGYVQILEAVAACRDDKIAATEG
jgi:carbon-monoxide dehydrogenase small subunit